jgi:hypothetical protein
MDHYTVLNFVRRCAAIFYERTLCSVEAPFGPVTTGAKVVPGSRRQQRVFGLRKRPQPIPCMAVHDEAIYIYIYTV